MRTIAIVFAAALLAGCPGKDPQPPAGAPPEKVDNAATRYVGGLQSGVERAKNAASAANAAEALRETEAEKGSPSP